MKKRILGRKLSRSKSARIGLLRSQTKAFAATGKIETTLAKAKFTQKFVEKLLAKAVNDTVHTRRIISAKLANDRKTTDLLFAMAKSAGKKNGFTRIVRLPSRRGDNSLMARLLLSFTPVMDEKTTKVVKKQTEKKTKKTKTVKKTKEEKIKSKKITKK